MLALGGAVSWKLSEVTSHGALSPPPGAAGGGQGEIGLCWW